MPRRAAHLQGEQQHTDPRPQLTGRLQTRVHVQRLGVRDAQEERGAARAEPRLGEAGDALGVADRDRGADGGLPRGVVHQRHHGVHQVLRALAEDACRVAVGVGLDDTAGRYGCGGGDARGLQGTGVEPGGVPGELVQQHGVFRRHLVQVLAPEGTARIGQTLLEVAGVPPVAEYPVTRREFTGLTAHGLAYAGDGRDGGPGDVERERRPGGAEGGGVQMGVVDPGERGAPLQVDDLGTGADKSTELGGTSGRGDQAVAHGDGLHAAERGVDGQHGAVDQHEVCGSGHGRPLSVQCRLGPNICPGAVPGARGLRQLPGAAREGCGRRGVTASRVGALAVPAPLRRVGARRVTR